MVRGGDYLNLVELATSWTSLIGQNYSRFPGMTDSVACVVGWVACVVVERL